MDERIDRWRTSLAWRMPPQEKPDAFVIEMRRLSTLSRPGALKSHPGNSPYPSSYQLDQGSLPGYVSEMPQTEPLSRLRQRDQVVLKTLFSHPETPGHMDEVQQYLRQLWPEPCWEDDPFTFLKGYI